ncbi:ATP-binding protein [Enterococcus sp. DIV1059_2]|uniref:ATP-binding protein n=1 Tax=Enterococcus sp. DIV1059_2 TaxID=2774664 RepID=UPI003F21E6F8
MEKSSLVASGAPTKSFFVDMLTRDIDLRDAILDLLDNCLDGVVRQKDASSPDDKEYYSNYRANINITSESFTIRDNCGGIPLDIAKQYAFRMGRLASDPENSLERPTVGVYGIGMKRAIFKIGDNAIIKTRHGDTAYSVLIDEDWIDSETNWDFPINIIEEYEGLDQGTEIKVDKLNENIKKGLK